jgi:ArsR family transcriptional regulator
MTETRGSAVMEQLFRALADCTRLRLLNLMVNREVCVCYFVEILGVAQPTISRHLAYLRRAGIVVARREGKWMHYRIAAPQDPSARELLVETMRWLAIDRGMREDRARLQRACCAPRTLARLRAAPKPVPVPAVA